MVVVHELKSQLIRLRTWSNVRFGEALRGGCDGSKSFKESRRQGDGLKAKFPTAWVLFDA